MAKGKKEALKGINPGHTSLSSSSPPTPDRIPFGYDPNYDYLSILKSSPRYAYEPTSQHPVFTYQDSLDKNLTELRNTYGLDKAAGGGDEILKIINLLKWVHLMVRHNGNNWVPEPINSLRILQYHHETGNGVNCVMMSIVLKEAYLSMGFKSRVVHGNSKHSRFKDEWHAFVMVYSHTLDKWLFVDPTNQAYFTDDNGNILSIAEIREHLIKDKPLILNDNADYNGNPVNVNALLNYLSKNFYRFSCRVNSEFVDYCVLPSSHSPVKNITYVHLDPENDRQEGLREATNYFTSNPDYLWLKP